MNARWINKFNMANFAFLSGTNIYYCPLCLRDFAVDKTKLIEHVLTCSFPTKSRDENKYATCSSDVSNSFENNPVSDSSAVTDDTSDSLPESVMIFQSTKIRSKGVER